MYGIREEDEVCGRRDMIKEIVKGVLAFCSYLFVPQWGKHRQ